MDSDTPKASHSETKASLFQLSQSHLQILETCPRKFQYLYVDQMGAPISSNDQARFLPGSQFHRLLQQRELGLSIATIAAENTPLDTWLDHFLKSEATIMAGGAAPETVPPPRYRDSEHLRSRLIDSFLLVAIYDLLVLYGDSAQILDWKTYPRPQNTQRLTQSWQTRLYLYLLAETSAFQPEQISMTYWFFQAPDSEDTITSQATMSKTLPFLRVNYSASLHRRTHQDLHKLLVQLKTQLAAYGEGQAFPQIPDGSRLCATCPFAVHCQRSPEAQSLEQMQLMALDFESIPEVTLAGMDVGN